MTVTTRPIRTEAAERDLRFRNAEMPHEPDGAAIAVRDGAVR